MSHILAIDANRYVVRLAVVGVDGYLHAMGEFNPLELDKQIAFIRGLPNKGLRVSRGAGSPLDNWPQDLQFILENEMGSINWLSPTFVRSTNQELLRWHQQRKFDRSRFIALAAQEKTGQYFDARTLIWRWQKVIGDEIQQHVEDTNPQKKTI
jgi:hypothetical protein